jgi:Ni/Fe-hydrogenase 1 B-type cytochrome subunit
MNDHQLHEHKAWPAALRWFHWINFTCIFGLFAMGLIMLNKSSLGISGNEAKIALKVVHVLIGYVFVANLMIRLVLGFVGPANMRWSKVLPGRGFGPELKRFKAAETVGRGHAWLGHNPKAKLALSVIYLLMFTQALTGLVRAGTDIYYPPFGSYVASQVAAEGVDPASLIPYDKTGVDEAANKALGEFKGPFGTVHVYSSYTLIALILLHIFTVVLVEVRNEGSLISSIFSGRKIFSGPPEDQ